jgi:chromosome segregation ATPase
MDHRDTIIDAANRMRKNTNVLEHEIHALQKDGEQQALDEIFELLGAIEANNTKLYRQLVAWHTKFPEKPTPEESDRVWHELKQLKQAKDRLQAAIESIREHEKRINSLATQLDNSISSISELEGYFDGYLDRVHQK